MDSTRRNGFSLNSIGSRIRSFVRTLTKRPILLGACLVTTAFAIATIVMLGLIPYFISRKSTTSATAPSTYLFTVNFNGTLGDDGPLDSVACDKYARAIEKANSFPTNGITVVSGRVITKLSKRKRRRLSLIRFRRGQTSKGNQVIELYIRYNETICSTSCQSRLPLDRLPNVSITVEFTYNGISVTVVGIVSFSITIPNGTSPTTLTNAPVVTTVNTTIIISSTTTTIITTTTTTTIGFTPSIG